MVYIAGIITIALAVMIVLLLYHFRWSRNAIERSADMVLRNYKLRESGFKRIKLLPKLIKIINNPRLDEKRRVEAQKLLEDALWGRHNYPASVAAKALQDTGWKPQTVEQAIEYSIVLGDFSYVVAAGEEAIPYLVKKDPDNYVVCEALARIGGPSTIAALHKHLQGLIRGNYTDLVVKQAKCLARLDPDLVAKTALENMNDRSASSAAALWVVLDNVSSRILERVLELKDIPVFSGGGFYFYEGEAHKIPTKLEGHFSVERLRSTARSILDQRSNR